MGLRAWNLVLVFFLRLGVGVEGFAHGWKALGCIRAQAVGFGGRVRGSP